MEAPQRMKRKLFHDGEHRGYRGDSTGPCNSLSERSDLFHFLALRAELAELEVLASKICLSRAPLNHKHRGTRLALHLRLYLRRRPDAADLPQPKVKEFLLLSRPVNRLHHMHGKQNPAVNP